MGLGPHKTSLLGRLGRPVDAYYDLTWVKEEQRIRNKNRLVKRIQYSRKNKKPGKPLAPVEQSEYRGEDNKRRWLWSGELIISRGLMPKCFYTTQELRDAGFRLPKLKKRDTKWNFCR